MPDTEDEDRLADALGPAAIHLLCGEQRNDIAPADARRLIETFCAYVEAGRPVPPALLDHLCHAIRDFLAGKNELEAALGLRRKGRPRVDEETRVEMAAAVARLRLTGKSHQDALAEISKKFCWAETVVGQAFAKHREELFDLLRAEREVFGEKLSDAEAAKLREICDGDHTEKSRD